MVSFACNYPQSALEISWKQIRIAHYPGYLKPADAIFKDQVSEHIVEHSTLTNFTVEGCIKKNAFKCSSNIEQKVYG